MQKKNNWNLIEKMLGNKMKITNIDKIWMWTYKIKWKGWQKTLWKDVKKLMWLHEIECKPWTKKSWKNIQNIDAIIRNDTQGMCKRHLKMC